MKNTLFLIISLAILLMPIDSSASIGGLRTFEGNQYLYTDCDPNWSVTAYNFNTTNHYYKLHGHGVCTQVYVNQPSYDKPGFHKPGKRFPDKPMTYGINLEINYNPIDQTFIEKATVSTAHPGDEFVTWNFTTTGRWPADPVIYYSPSEGPLWNLATSSSPACEIYTNCIPMIFPLFVNSLPGAQLEQLANEARSAPPPPCNPTALGPPTIVSPPKEGNPLFKSKNVPFYFEIPSCKFTDYKKNVFLIEAQKRKPSPNSDDPTFLPWEPFPLPDWSMIKMKPAIYDKDIRSFGAKTIRIGTEEEYAKIRFRVKSIIWFQNKFHDTDFTDWQYLRVGKPDPPDFRIRSVKAFPKVENNKPVLVFAWTIENIGTGKGDVTGFGLKRCLINGQNSCPPDFEDRKNWRVHGWQFWPGDGIDLYPNKTADVWVTVPRPLEPTHYGFLAKADFIDLVEESDESNNEHRFEYVSPAIEKLSINNTAALKSTSNSIMPDQVKSPEVISATSFTLPQKVFNLKDSVPITLPSKTASLQFQHRERSSWRATKMPRKLNVKEIKDAKGMLYRQAYKFDQTGHYRYRWRSANGQWSDWQEFEIKGGISPKTNKALLPAIKLDKGTSATGPMVKPKKLKPAKIISLRPGHTYTSGDKIKLRADYDRSHKVNFVLQEKRGGIYRTYKTVGNGNFDKLKPGTYRVGVVYHGDKGLPEKWIEFSVAEGKKLKVPPSATKKLDPGSLTKKKPTINLN